VIKEVVSHLSGQILCLHCNLNAFFKLPLQDLLQLLTRSGIPVRNFSAIFLIDMKV
jgi:hypothetical protein